jgi:ABC-2 type transport system permease protein
LLLLGGMVIPFGNLPLGLRAIARVLPSGALADVIREALTGAADRPGLAWIVLAAWAVATPVAASRLFRWE